MCLVSFDRAAEGILLRSPFASSFFVTQTVVWGFTTGMPIGFAASCIFKPLYYGSAAYTRARSAVHSYFERFSGECEKTRALM